MSSEPPRAAEPRLVVISGPSGAGKSSVAARLLADDSFARAVTATTRAPRGAERDGVDYHFLDPAEFDRWLEEGRLLEHAEVYGGNRYGTPRAGVDAILAAGRHCVLVVDVRGADSLRRLRPASLFVFIAPPTLAELEARLRARGEDDEAAIRARVAEAERELAAAERFDEVVVNEDVERAAARVRALLSPEGS